MRGCHVQEMFIPDEAETPFHEKYSFGCNDTSSRKHYTGNLAGFDVTADQPASDLPAGDQPASDLPVTAFFSTPTSDPATDATGSKNVPNFNFSKNQTT